MATLIVSVPPHDAEHLIEDEQPMKFNSKVTGGLAWAGLVLILAVPSADMLTKPSAFRADPGGTIGEDAATGGADVTKTAAIKAPTPAIRSIAPASPVASDDPVGSYVASGKPLPSYISDAPAAAPAAEKVATAPVAPAAIKKIVAPSMPQTAAVKSDGTLAGVTDTMTTASIDTAGVTPPPVPYPASLRPAGRVASTATGRQPLIVDEESLVRDEVALRSGEPFLPQREPRIIDDEELEEWDSGSLADYLERRGLISDSDRAVRTLERQYDEDGFFLSDGPNSRARVIRRYRDGDDLF